MDNGPSEQPSSPLVQMLLVRLLKFLKLKKIVQVSFAEYHSKRNFVERVHSIENFALSVTWYIKVHLLAVRNIGRTWKPWLKKCRNV